MPPSAPRPTAIEHSTLPLRTTDTHIPSPSTQSGMGLPYELWEHIINFLSLEPYALFACYSTCWAFRGPAGKWLWILSYLDISLHDYTDLDRLVEEVRTTPGRAQSVRRLSLSRTPLAFSLVPHRLATQLINLRDLRLEDIPEAPKTPSSTWSLYGRAFPGVVTLTLAAVQLPSFMDFIRFIASFRTLRKLYLTSISCAHLGVPPGIQRLPYKLNPLDTLGLHHMDEDEGHFLDLFIPWFRTRGGAVQELLISDTITLHPLSFLLLQSIHTHLRRLYISFGEYSPMGKLQQKSWRKFISVFSHEFPGLHELTLFHMRDQHLPRVRSLLAHAAKPTLVLHMFPYPDENRDFGAWHTLDNVLFAFRRKLPLFYAGTQSKALFPLMSLIPGR